ncbi:MAG: helix-turn-helix domain-containing protein [Defluviitaleaceae bacterium]|nr:helix-turn-helix domain-containing protein [Defluviitaleaceae bacterium]
MKPLHLLLRDMRLDRDIKQQTIAELIKTTQQQYSKYEKGTSDLPLRVLPILAEFYDVSADFLIGRAGDYFNIPQLEMSVTESKSAKDMLDDVLSLDSAGREAVVEYVFLQKLKEEHYRQKEKDEEK